MAGSEQRSDGAVVDPERLRHLERLRPVRDRMDREFASPLDVESLARGVHMSAGHLSREFKVTFGATSVTGELPACLAKQVTRPIRNREAARPLTSIGSST